ncbi:hypothetical protein DPMN_127943 [Dreissena polymorpha]|uniref:DUF6729 domain-containing protein n=2 Tax=Dreissena polymorpha TaxID=45954 RepID=A0A9D4JWY6_DREPO|nr:hypothetical protein DPMN_127943 [Dreissena polymorpha]
MVSAGPYEHVREVLGLTGYYYCVTEELQCKGCQKRLLSWSQAHLDQLDAYHRQLFPVLLTYKYACDITVVTLMRTRGLSNSAAQLRGKLVEEHSQEWMRKAGHYLGDCESIFNSKLVSRQSICEPPAQPEVPSAFWLRSVYCNDIMARVDAVKAAITSTFGRILKIDSTKKVTKKLTGQTRGNATWATNVGNEKGQVLMCVMTCAKGIGLGPMIAGLVDRMTGLGNRRHRWYI